LGSKNTFLIGGEMILRSHWKKNFLMFMSLLEPGTRGATLDWDSRGQLNASLSINDKNLAKSTVAKKPKSNQGLQKSNFSWL